jgi:hypothetical protein
MNSMGSVLEEEYLVGVTGHGYTVSDAEVLRGACGGYTRVLMFWM